MHVAVYYLLSVAS